MNHTLKFSILFIIMEVLFNTSCKKADQCKNCQSDNMLIAKAGADQIIHLPQDSVLLDGSASNDPRGTIVAYKWIKILGPASFNILQPDSPKTLIKSLVYGYYSFELTVIDNLGLSAKNTVQVIVRDSSHLPFAHAGPDQVVTLNADSILLDAGGSFSQDGNIVSYLWSKISGPASFSIHDSTAVGTAVDHLVTGVYLFTLKVTDSWGKSAKDTIQITVNPGRPVLNAQLIPIGTLSEARANITAGTTGNKIVFAGGYGEFPISWGHASSKVDIYNITTNSWTASTLSIPRMYMVAASAGDKILFGGGYDTNDYDEVSYSNVDIYDATNNSWNNTHMSQQRYLHAAAVLNNKVFFAGGSVVASSGIYHIANGVDVYDLSSNSWSTMPFSHPRSGLSAIAAGNKVYFAGGYSEIETPPISNRIDIYDGSSWSVSTLNQPMLNQANISDAGKIYWAGGGVIDPGAVEIRDLNTQSSSYGNLFEPNAQFATVQSNNRIVYFTGSGTANDKFDIYDIASHTWLVGVLNIHLSGAAIVSVNNTIYVAGGYVNGVLSNKVYKLII